MAFERTDSDGSDDGETRVSVLKARGEGLSSPR